MDAYERVWCGWLAGVVTPELADRLREARELALAAGAQQLAADLLRWEERLLRAMALQQHAGKVAGGGSEVWIG
jgi:hypothetical protein